MSNLKTYNSMRSWWSWEVYKQMQTDQSIYVLTADLGYGMWDTVKRDFPHRFVNVGAAEQVLMGMAVGLALSGKRPVVYSISSFAIYRPFETIKLYINRERLPVIIAPGGRDDDYKHDGPSHHSFGLPTLLQEAFPAIQAHFPKTKEEIPAVAAHVFSTTTPQFVSLKRE